MLKSRKHVFWEALLVAVIVFVFGFLLGIGYESTNMLKVNNFYIQSEIDLADELAIIELMNQNEYSCDTLRQVTIDLANRVYEDAKQIERYEQAGVITQGLEIMHIKFDVLRTFIWINTFEVNKKCGDENSYTVIVYLYEQNTRDLVKRANQNVWSKILSEVKEEYGSEVLLIPIAADNDIQSLRLLLSTYDIESYPAIIINNEVVLTELTHTDDIKAHL